VTAPGQPVVDFVDSNGFFTNPRYRGVSSLTWLYGPWTSSLTYRYVHSYDQALVTGQTRIGRYADADLYVSYEGFKNLKIFGSVRNIHDTDRPWDASSTNGLDFQVHDLRGRYFTVGLNYSFK
jgi:iron complex outermembrane receptor protein